MDVTGPTLSATKYFGRMITNEKGGYRAYKGAISAINLLFQNEIPVCMTITIHRQNASQIDSIIDLALNQRVSRIRFGFFNPSGRGINNNSEHVLNIEERRAIYEYIVQRKEELKSVITMDSRERFYGLATGDSRYDFINCGTLFCRAATRIMFISSQGYVAPCYMLNEPSLYGGNVREASLLDIWRSSPVFNEFRELRISRIDGCKSCDRQRDCGAGLRCAAYGLYNRIDEKDPQCIYGNEYLKNENKYDFVSA